MMSDVDGFNVSLFTYGQTESGKTHMLCDNIEEEGVIILPLLFVLEEIKYFNKEQE